MKKTFLLISFLCFSSLGVFAYTPLTISSGFNDDVIADGVGSALSSTTADVDGVNYCFVSDGWQLTSTSTPLSSGLPASGLINSAVTSGLSFQMASYSGDNDLRLPFNNASGTLTFQTPMAAQTLYILAVTGSGSSTMTVEINFTDLTSQMSGSITVDDWYGGSNVALTGFQRLNMTNNSLDNSATGPNLYQYSIPINLANQTKPIASITVTRTTGSGFSTTLNVFAVSIDESALVTCPAPSALTTTNVTTSGADLGWTENGSATQWEVEYGASGFTQGSGTSQVTGNNPLSISGLSASTAYDFYVRAICGAGDSSTWTGPYTFSTACVTPAILSHTDSSRCGPGSVTLHATADSGAMIKWYAAATGGTALGSGSTFTTPSLSATTTYYVAAAGTSAGCESAREAVVATIMGLPIVDLGPDTTLCPGVTYPLDAGNPGATYSWNTGASSQVLNVTSIGDYSVIVTDGNGCENYDTAIITAGIVAQDSLPASLDLCEGSTDTLDAGNPGFSYSWNTGASAQKIVISTGGTYTVDITSSDGCVLTSSTQVTLRPLPDVDLGADTSICPSASIVLDAGNPGSDYFWNTGATAQTINTTDSGLYSVVVTSPYNCVSSDQKQVSFLAVAQTDGFNFIPQFGSQWGQIEFIAINPIDVDEYEWDFGDGSPVATLSNPIHIYTESGSYVVSLKVTNGCGHSEVSLPINVDLTTGVVSLRNQKNGFLLYPNPTTGMIRIQNEEGTPIREISIVNMLGQEVYRQQISGTLTPSINVSHLANGIYSLMIRTNDQMVMERFELIK